jgi:hypothetical protein
MTKKSSATSKNRKLRKHSPDFGELFVKALAVAFGTEIGKFLAAALIRIIMNGSHYASQAPFRPREGACFL